MGQKNKLQWFEFADGPEQGLKCPCCGLSPVTSLYVIAESEEQARKKREEAMCHSCSGAPDSFSVWLGFDRKPTLLQFNDHVIREEIQKNEW